MSLCTCRGELCSPVFHSSLSAGEHSSPLLRSAGWYVSPLPRRARLPAPFVTDSSPMQPKSGGSKQPPLRNGMCPSALVGANCVHPFFTVPYPRANTVRPYYGLRDGTSPALVRSVLPEAPRFPKSVFCPFSVHWQFTTERRGLYSMV